jgi:hypothetical protein
MRTTVTLDPDAEAMVKDLMRERGVTFKQAVNQAIRAGLGRTSGERQFHTPTFAMGPGPATGLDKALRLAGALEDEELARRLASRK